MQHCEEVLAFWFGDLADEGAAARRQERLWWNCDAQTDALIGERFGALREQAIRGELSAWSHTARGRLALILLTDQFSRSIHRGTPLAFAADPLAREWCLDGLRHDYDLALRHLERVFFYLPLEHAESRELQARSVELMQALVEEVPPAQRKLFESYAGYARRHREVIERFGRFPHRNAILGRDSTPEEVEFLKQPGSSF